MTLFFPQAKNFPDCMCSFGAFNRLTSEISNKQTGGAFVADVLELFDRYHDNVYRLALSYTKSVPDAEDVVQTVFLKLLDCKSPRRTGRSGPG